MKINLKNRCKAFSEMKEMLWQSLDIILLVAQSELEEAGYTVSHKFTGQANDALTAALNPDDGSLVPEIYIFLPDARLVPPDPNSTLLIDIKRYTNQENVKMVSDVFIHFQNENLQKHAEFVADIISGIIKPGG